MLKKVLFMKGYKGLLVWTMIFSTSMTYGQLGGGRIFQFLNTPHNAKAAALGGILPAYSDNDPGLVNYNPASLNASMHNQLQFSESFYAPGVKYSSFNFTTGGKEKKRYWAFGVQNLSFEEMDHTDESGTKIGSFFGNETALYATTSHSIGNYTIGFTGKYAQSFIERFASVAVLGDVGVMFKHPEKELNIGLVMRNAGIQVLSYSGIREPLPFQVNAGITFKPEHMPLKMSIVLHDLQTFNTVYLDPEPVCIGFGCDTMIAPTSTLGDKVLRHFNFAGDLKFSKNIQFRMAYSFQRRKELKLNKSGGAGFTLGLRVRIKNFDVEYGKIYYQYAGRPTYITITTNTSRFFKKKNKNIVPDDIVDDAEVFLPSPSFSIN